MAPEAASDDASGLMPSSRTVRMTVSTVLIQAGGPLPTGRGSGGGTTFFFPPGRPPPTAGPAGEGRGPPPAGPGPGAPVGRGSLGTHRLRTGADDGGVA